MFPPTKTSRANRDISAKTRRATFRLFSDRRDMSSVASALRSVLLLAPPAANSGAFSDADDVNVSRDLDAARSLLAAAAGELCGLRIGASEGTAGKDARAHLWTAAATAVDEDSLACATPPKSVQASLGNIRAANALLDGLLADLVPSLQAEENSKSERDPLRSPGVIVAACWWRVRSAALEQRHLDGPSARLFGIVRECVEVLGAEMVRVPVLRAESDPSSGAVLDGNELEARANAWRAVSRLLDPADTGNDATSDDEIVEQMFAVASREASGDAPDAPGLLFDGSTRSRVESADVKTLMGQESSARSDEESGADLDALASFGLDSEDDEPAHESELFDSLSFGDDITARGWLLLELANFLMTGNFEQFSRVARALSASAACFGVSELGVTGSMGVRTKHQKKATAQLVPLLKRSDDPRTDLHIEACSTSRASAVPELDAGPAEDEDGIYTTPKVQSSGNPTPDDTSTLEMCLAIVKSEFHRRSHVKDDTVAREQSSALLRLAEESVSSTMASWGVTVAAAMVRASLESDFTKTEGHSGKSRHALRALSLLDSLKRVVYEQSNVVDADELSDRVRWVWCAPVPDEGAIHEVLGDLYLSIGDSRSAINSYEAVGQWERLIRCYMLLQQQPKAERIVRDQLAIAEPEGRSDLPLLYCLLGEITDSEEWLEKSWESSNGRFARAKRALGRLAFDKGDVKGCCEHFRQSLEINPLFYTAWFTYGSALGHPDMGESDEVLQRAVSAYRRCVALKPDDGMSWNNLAALYLRLKQKRAAYRALGQALRHLNRSWKVWENFLNVCTDLHEYRHAIRAMTHLVTIGSQTTTDDRHQNRARDERPDGKGWIDKEILDILVRVIIDDLPDSQGNASRETCRRDFEGLLKVIEHLHVRASEDADLWVVFRNYAIAEYHLPPMGDEKLNETVCLLKAVGYFDREWRALTQLGKDHESWRNQVEPFERVVKMLQALFETVGSLMVAARREHAAGDLTREQSAAAVDKVFSIRTKLNAAIKKTADAFGGTEDHRRLENLFAQAQQVEADAEQWMKSEVH
jgi:tetratricopeptide (TPR) repeat protein